MCLRVHKYLPNQAVACRPVQSRVHACVHIYQGPLLLVRGLVLIVCSSPVERRNQENMAILPATPN